MRAGSFLCGCPVAIDATLTFDAQDFIVCAEHAQRAYGWRSSQPHDPLPETLCGWEKRRRDRRLLAQMAGLPDPDPLVAA